MFLEENPDRKKYTIKFKKRTMHSSFRDNIQGADLADMQLIGKHSKGVRFLICTIDIYSKYAWNFSFKDKKCITSTNTFKKMFS